MANKRMFNKEVVGSDQFLDLPVSSRELYFQLGMYADDDGFVSPKKVIRMVGASDDDIKVLTAKGFLIPFESGVIVIRHWKDNNYIRLDTYKQTLYQNEFKIAQQDELYSRPRAVHETVTQYSIDKSRVEENRGEISSSYKKKQKPYYEGFEMRNAQGKWWVLKDGAWLEFADLEEKIEWR